MSLGTNHFYEFGNFRLDPTERVLFCESKPLPLTPKAFHMLLILIENRGRIVEKEKLMDEIWADSFVEEGSLSVNARRLRLVLEDDASRPKFIETIPRRGYRFIADVKEVSEDQPPAEPAVAETLPKTSAARSKLFAPLAAAGLLIAAALIYYFAFAGTSAAGDRRSIAVLPVRPINSAIRDELYEIGIAESLINRLALMKGFVVRPLSATRAYTDVTQDPLEAGREQKVDYVLAANYQFAGGKIRVTAQLLNVATGQIEETYKGEKDTADIFAMQDAIANEVGNIFLARFATTSTGSPPKRWTNNEEAYRLYLHGMNLSNRRTGADARKAVEALEQAVRLDPNYALAWAGKAYAHRAVGNYGRSVNTHDEYQKSMEAINRALALDENLSEAYSALCENKMYYEYDSDGAERACKRAIELDPNSSLAHQVYSRYLPGRGRFDEAIAEAKIAIDLEPASVFHQHMLGNVFHYARRYQEAEEQYKRVLAMDENHGNTQTRLVATLALQGKESEAFEWFTKSLNAHLLPSDEKTAQKFRTVFQTSGWQGIIRERAKIFDETDEAYGRGATWQAQIGNKDEAFEYLEKSFQRREIWMCYLQVDPLLDPIRDDPRYHDLVRRVESGKAHPEQN